MQTPKLLVTLTVQNSGPRLHLLGFPYCSTLLWILIGISAFFSQLPFVELETEHIILFTNIVSQTKACSCPFNVTENKNIFSSIPLSLAAHGPWGAKTFFFVFVLCQIMFLLCHLFLCLWSAFPAYSDPAE